MLGTRRFLFGGMSLSALGLAGLALAASAPAIDKPRPLLGLYTNSPGGGLLGITVLQPSGAQRARATVALSAGGAVDVDGKGTVGWSTKPCSRTFASPAAKGGGEVAIESLELAHEGLSFATRSIPLTGAVTKGKTVRVWNGRTQLACTSATTPRTATIATAIFRGRIKGAFAAVKRRTARNFRGYLALPELDASANYRMAGSRRSCSKPDTAGSRTFSVELKRPGGFSTQIIEHLEDLVGVPGTASVRLLRRAPGGSATQVACAVTTVYAGDTD